MTIKPYIAAVAVASSLALFFGQTAHAQVPNINGRPPSFKMHKHVHMQKPRAQFPGGFPPQQVYYRIQVKERIKISERGTWSHDVPHRHKVHRKHHVSKPRTHSTPNRYVKGQCTWYAKKRRPDLPNGLGNANTWYVRAGVKGFSVGSKPRVGAVGTTTQGRYGHVVYVERVYRNGKIRISEMNFNGGVGVVHKRTVAASQFRYIYKHVA